MHEAALAMLFSAGNLDLPKLLALDFVNFRAAFPKQRSEAKVPELGRLHLAA